ncbi:mitochondrial metal transporter [Coemansia sp. RSA 1813]|nr:mitochondrial metal transporter [Coemansia sp. RSA 1843]KAJ2087476.1 mitochondrial metal transporter [Coemansia sp. RSA 986]KAJ2211705.1 mitochondrial metal transporter [Coemansia sp. RSA 487]KAJ2566656.1 mitochondrial metal transporter [Coemansia sp. RSA 1813]
MTSIQCQRLLRHPPSSSWLHQWMKPTGLAVPARFISIYNGSRSKDGNNSRPWTKKEASVLRDTASNFSSFSHTLRKESNSTAEPRESHHSHSHSHGLFSVHTHGSEDHASKIELLEHNKAGSRITLIGMGANFGMSVAKGLAGVHFHSSALLADAAHSMSDIIGDLVTLYTFRKSRQPVDAGHPYGYGRYEALGTLFISAFLVASGFGIGAHALEQVVHLLPDTFSAFSASSHSMVESAREIAGAVVNSSSDTAASVASGGTTNAAPGSSSLLGHSHSHSHGMHTVVDGTVVVDPRAIWFGIGSIVVNEALYQATMKVGKRTKSNVLIANAWHHRSDSLTSLVSVGAIGGALMGFPVLDAVGGLVVSTMLAWSGATMTMDAVKEITDTPPSAQYTDDIHKVVREAVEKVPQIHKFGDIMCRKSGPFIHVHVALTFDKNERAVDIEDAVSHIRSQLRAKLAFVQKVDVEIRADQ